MTSVTNNGQFCFDEFGSNKGTSAIPLSAILEKSFRLGHFRHNRSKKFLLKIALFPTVGGLLPKIYLLG